MRVRETSKHLRQTVVQGSPRQLRSGVGWSLAHPDLQYDQDIPTLAAQTCTYWVLASMPHL